MIQVQIFNFKIIAIRVFKIHPFPSSLGIYNLQIKDNEWCTYLKYVCTEFKQEGSTRWIASKIFNVSLWSLNLDLDHYSSQTQEYYIFPLKIHSRKWRRMQIHVKKINLKKNRRYHTPISLAPQWLCWWEVAYRTFEGKFVRKLVGVKFFHGYSRAIYKV